MVRTKADRVQTKAVGSKAPAKMPAQPSPVTPVKVPLGKGKSYGGSPYHPRETPEWQKPITKFLNPDSVYSEPAAKVASPKRGRSSQKAKVEEICDEDCE